MNVRTILLCLGVLVCGPLCARAQAAANNDAAICAEAASVLEPKGDHARQAADCACITPKLKASLIPDDYAYRAQVNALIADGTINTIDFNDEILAFMQAHYRTGPSAADAPKRIDAALATARKACGISPKP
jgi:hypothetical protein